jgi:hypothetical protein
MSEKPAIQNLEHHDETNEQELGHDDDDHETGEDHDDHETEENHEEDSHAGHDDHANHGEKGGHGFPFAHVLFLVGFVLMLCLDKVLFAKLRSVLVKTRQFQKIKLKT